MAPPNSPDLPEVVPVAMVIFSTLIFLAISACIMTWGVVASLWFRRLPVLPYQPRRVVPWRASDLLFIVLFYLAMQGGIFAAISAVVGPNAFRPPAMYDLDTIDTSHSVARLMADSGPWTLLLCLVSLVAIAPIVEEFFFRVLLQGWLERLERRGRPQMLTLRRLMPLGLWPILIASFLFARMHFRAGPSELNMKTFAWILAGDGAAKLLTMAFAVGWLRWRVGATATDFGWAPKKLLGDIRLGLIGFIMIAAPIYGLQFALGQLLPKHIAPDPFPLFFLAIALGLLYYRTHRMTPSIVVHAALNGTSLLLWVMR